MIHHFNVKYNNKRYFICNTNDKKYKGCFENINIVRVDLP